MRIDANQPLANQIAAERSNRNSSQSGAPADSAGDGASFSPETGGVAGLAAQALATPEVRQDRVEALRQAIGNGTYQLNPQQIAEAMLSEASR